MTPTIGSTEPIAGERQSLHPRYTLDIGLAQVLGTQPLIDNGAIRVRAVPSGLWTKEAMLTAANQAQQIAAGNSNTVSVQIAGTFVGTLTFQCTLNGVDWLSCAATPSDGTAVVTTATAPGIWTIASAGLREVRVLVSAYTSGTILIILHATSAQR